MGFSRRKPQVDAHRAADPEAVRAGALAMLARREYAAAELQAALVRKGYATDVVAEAVAELIGERLIDDNRYAEALVRQLAGRGQGPSRIRRQLAEAGLSAALVARVLDEGPDWHAMARQVRIRKFGAETPADWPSRARQMRFLQYRGFSNDHIGSCLGDDPGAPDSDP